MKDQEHQDDKNSHLEHYKKNKTRKDPDERGSDKQHDIPQEKK